MSVLAEHEISYASRVSYSYAGYLTSHTMANHAPLFASLTTRTSSLHLYLLLLFVTAVLFV